MHSMKQTCLLLPTGLTVHSRLRIHNPGCILEVLEFFCFQGFLLSFSQPFRNWTFTVEKLCSFPTSQLMWGCNNRKNTNNMVLQENMNIWWRSTDCRESGWDPSALIRSNEVSVLQDWSWAVQSHLDVSASCSQHSASRRWISYFQRMRKSPFARLLS